MSRQKKQRKEGIRFIAPKRYLIVCEGTKTEPLYFEAIKKKIELKYKDRLDVREVSIDIDGTGRNTESLVKYTMRVVKESLVPYNNVWCVFDKDDFSNSQFNDAILKSENEGYQVAWSNESIELWFILHFEYLNSSLKRSDYISKLNEIFTQKNINNGSYKKNQNNIFEILYLTGSLHTAIANAKKLDELYCDVQSPAKMNPSTKVYKLVEELIDYI